MTLIDNLKYYWKLDGNANDSVDSNNFLVSGVTFNTPGIIGNGATFNTGYLRALNTTTDEQTFSISMWIKPTNVENNPMIVAHWRSTPQFNFLSRLGDNGAGKLSFYVSIASYGVNIHLASTTTLSNNNWYHIVMIADGVNQMSHMWINNVYQGNVSWGQARYINIGANFNFGSDSDGAGEYYAGEMDEIGIWNKALSNTEVNELYNSGVGKQYPFYDNKDEADLPLNLEGKNDFKLYLPMKERSGNWTYDYSQKDTNDIGGTITYDGAYTIHTFNSSGTYVCTSDKEVEILVIGGGGAGGIDLGGGGGAGGLIHNTSYKMYSGTHNVIIGAGGISQPGGSRDAPTNEGYPGENTSFGNLVAFGGGGGSYYKSYAPELTAMSGGCGGGGGAMEPGYWSIGGSGSQGFGGGSGTGYVGAGGGGTTGIGQNPSVLGQYGTGGNGGTGFTSSISGTSVTYAGGGGGGSYLLDRGTGGTGGCASAGNGGGNFLNATDGWPNSGSGGGGGVQSTGPAEQRRSGAGGSGIVIIRYLTRTNSLANGLIDFWNFEDTLLSHKGTDLGGIDQRAYESGKINRALGFNGTTDYLIPVPSYPEIAGANPKTLSAWIKWDNFTGDQITMGLGSYTGDNQFFGFSASFGAVYFATYNGYTLPLNLIQVGQWTHCLARYDGNKTDVFVNGRLMGTDPSRVLNTQPTIWFSSQIWKFTGLLDAVGVWDRALTDTEVANLYNAGVGLQYPFPEVIPMAGRLVNTTPGAIGQVFNGTDAHIPIQPIPVTFPMTITYWAKDNANLADIRMVMTKGNTFSGISNGWGSGKPLLLAARYLWRQWAYTGYAADNLWHHYAWELAQDVTQSQLWIDGVLQTVDADYVYPTLIWEMTEIDSIGHYYNPYPQDYYYKGELSDLYFYDRHLSEDEIKAIYKQTMR